MRATVLELDGSKSHVEFTETSPTPTLEWGLAEWRGRGWKMTEEGYALAWHAVSRVIPEIPIVEGKE
jgi:hypothetical protein